MMNICACYIITDHVVSEIDLAVRIGAAEGIDHGETLCADDFKLDSLLVEQADGHE